MSENKTIASVTIPLDFCQDISILSDEINRVLLGEINHNSSEQYVYLGMINDSHFYLHVVHNANFVPTISHQIYNVMINERMIIEPDKNIIVYEFYPNGEQKAIIIQHSNSTSRKILSSDNLKDFFSKITKAERHDMFLIEYDYDKKCYFTYELESPPPPMDSMTIDTLSLEYVITSKPLY